MISKLFSFMSDKKNKSIPQNELSDLRGQLAAINKIQGVIEFDLTGHVTAVNEN